MKHWIFFVFISLVTDMRKGNCNVAQRTLKASTAFVKDDFTQFVIWKTVTKNVGLCGFQCYKDENCFSVLYNGSDNTCQGHNVIHTGQRLMSGLQKTQDVKLYVVQGKKISLVGVETNGSSLFDWDGFGHIAPSLPSNAIDCDMNTGFHSSFEVTTYPYMYIKWDKTITVTYAGIYPRQDATFRFDDVYVFVGFDNGPLDLCDNLVGQATGPKTEFICMRPIVGNVLKVEHRGILRETDPSKPNYFFRILEIFEIEIFGFRN